MNDPYSVLGVSPSASDEEIKKVYRDLARKYHPDNYQDNPLADLAQEKMKAINEAYDTITRARAGGSSQSGQSYSQSYAQQMNTMLGLLAKCGGVARYTRPQGGLFIFAELKEGMNAAELLLKCVDKGVAYVPGTHFYADGGHENTFRLNFSMSTVEQIEKGMGLLNQVFSECC